MENPEPLPKGPPPSENLKPLMEMLEMLEPNSEPTSRLGRMRQALSGYAPRVAALAGTLWARAVIGGVAAAAFGGTIWHFAHSKPAVPVMKVAPPAHAAHTAPMHARTLHKHAAAHPKHHKGTHKKPVSHKKHPAQSTGHTSGFSGQANT
jgi:hypothetical protein